MMNTASTASTASTANTMPTPSSEPLTTDTTPRQSLAHTWRAFTLEMRYDWISSWRQLDFAVPTLLFPAFFYLFFGILFGRNNGLATYLIATYGAFGVIGTALFSFGVGIAVARDRGELLLKRVTPAPSFAVIGAKMGTAVIFSLLVLLELFLLGALLGGLRLERADWLALSAILLGGAIPFAALGLAIGTHVSGKGAPAIVNLIYLPTAFLSGLWIPITMLPDALQKLALFMPPYHLAQLALKVLGLDAGQPWPLHLGALLIMTVVSIAVASRGLNR